MQQRVGIICDMEQTWCPQYKNYYYAVEYLYGKVKLIKTLSDLDGLDILFMGDDHNHVHRNIFAQKGLVEACDNIKVVVMTSEKIFDSFFPWNVDNYKYLQRFKHLYHYTVDVDDCEKLGTKLHRLCMSKHFEGRFKTNGKIDKIVFKGSMEGKCYQERKNVLKAASKILSLDILTNAFLWDDYMDAMGRYKYVFSPVGNINGLPIRFYEALLIDCIILQQVRENTLKYYDIEAEFGNCIFFEHPEELPSKISNFKNKNTHSEIWLEDYLGMLLKEDDLL